MKMFLRGILCLLLTSAGFCDVTQTRLYDFTDDAANDIKISSTKVDGELDQDIASLNKKVLISSTAPSSPIDGQTWVDISKTPATVYTYDGTTSRWVSAAMDADGDTKIQFEEAADEDTIRFDVLGSEAMVIDSIGTVTKPLQPAFQAVPSIQQSNIATGGVTITFVERFDLNGDFGSNTFTAPVDGYYFLQCYADLDEVDSASTLMELKIVTSNKTYSVLEKPSLQMSGDGAHGMYIGVYADMDASDTATAQLEQTAGAAQCDIKTSSWFAGVLVN